jgi:SET domain-containing protein
MTQALALGLGSMFNHSTKAQNVRWSRNTEHDYIVYTSICDIEAGEELCISYGSGVLWFDDVEEHDEARLRTPEQLSIDEGVDVDTGGGTLAELELSGLSGIEYEGL